MLGYIQKIKISGLAPNQKVHAIKAFIYPKLHYASANNIIKISDLQFIDQEIRNAIIDAIKGQPLPKYFIYSKYKDGSLGLAKCEDEYYTSKIYHATPLMKTEHAHRILKGSGKLNENQCLPAFQLLFPAVKKALTKLKPK
jgi:hypothetical protein